jgi:tRNA pseudouridine13 synthase
MNEPDELVPHQPDFATVDLPPAGGSLGPEPEDFAVEELPAYSPSGLGDHWWILVKKRLHTTPDLVRAVARAADVPERDLGYAGMKDRHAVATQWLSVPARGRPPGDWELPAGIELVQVARHSNKLRTGHLRGNRFSLRLVGLDANSFERARLIADRLRESGLYNYFGAQRFGRDGKNLGRAVDWLRQGAPRVGSRTRLLRKLYPSVVQAEVFNRYLTARRGLGMSAVLPGEVVRLDRGRAVFVVQDPTREQPRFLAHEIHLTGPIWGPKMKAASGQLRELELSVAAELGWDERLEEQLASLVDGTRRDLVVWPENLQLERLDEHRLRLEFMLPAGSYATQLLSEFTRRPLDGPEGRA